MKVSVRLAGLAVGVALLTLAPNAMAATVAMVKDINVEAPGTATPADSYPSHLTALADFVYFGAVTDATGSELWRTNGIEAGTTLVKDINPGAAGSNPSEFAALGDSLYFRAADESHGGELWRTDGSEAGTTLVKDINPGAEGSDPTELTALGGYLYFDARTAANGYELWRTDGTDAGTTLVKDILAGPNSSIPFGLTAANGVLYFDADDGAGSGGHRVEPWTSDGTPAGTTILKDINPGPNSSGDEVGEFRPQFTALGGDVFFTASQPDPPSDVLRTDLWHTDGTEAGTTVVDVFPGGIGGPRPFDLTAFNGFVYFSAQYDEEREWEPWRTDGTVTGTTLVKDVSNGGTWIPSGYTALGSFLYFLAGDSTTGAELFRTDGSSAGTTLVKDIAPGAADSIPFDFTALGNVLYFVATDDVHGEELWATDGTAAGTALVSDIKPGPESSKPWELTTHNGSLYFQADDGCHGSELWRVGEGAVGAICKSAPDPGDCSLHRGAANNGCPDIKRKLSLDFNSGTNKFTGRLSAGDPCVAKQKIKIYRKKHGKDPVIAKAKTKRSGKYAKKLNGDPDPGSYYATAKAKTIPSAANCLAAKSPSVKVD